MATIGDCVSFMERGRREVGTLRDFQMLSPEAVIETDDGLTHIVHLSQIEQLADGFLELYEALMRRQHPSCFQFPQKGEAEFSKGAVGESQSRGSSILSMVTQAEGLPKGKCETESLPQSFDERLPEEEYPSFKDAGVKR